MQPNHRFPLPWLTTGIIALAVSGLFSIIVSVAWHPAIRCISLFETLFQRSLIAHVNLSITVWFLCILFMIWSWRRQERRPLAYYDITARVLVLLTIVAMAVAAFLPSAIPYLNNYIPTLGHPLFFLSLGLLTASILVKSLELGHLWLSGQLRGQSTIDTHNQTTLLMLLAALGAIIASRTLMEPGLSGEIFYELLFWGGGHILQYVWVQLMMLAWLILLEALIPDFQAHRGYRVLLWLNMLIILTTPVPFLLHEISSPYFRQMFTDLMAWFSGIIPSALVLLYMINSLRGHHRLLFPLRHPYGACLWWSLILFGVGGAFALMIDGINVKIPAHYHGSLIGVTLALMGLSYRVLEEHGYHYISRSRLARIQPSLLGIGQIMHIGGLFWSGGYGVQRKSPCSGGEAMQQADLALRIQSTGGGIAILGGLIFVIVCLIAWRKGSDSAKKVA